MKRKILGELLFLLLGIMFSHSVFAQIELKNLRCEMRLNPLGIDVVAPRLSWEITSFKRNVHQISYQIIVSSSREKLARGDGDYWNSGKVFSDQSIHVEYAGEKLRSRAACFWKVIVTTNKGTALSKESAYWSIGLLNTTDWEAKWIGYDHASVWDSISQFSRLSARYFRKPFQSVGNIKKATVYMVGLGLYELYVNGKKIGDQVLSPNPTDYRKSYFFTTHDVTAQLREGKNAIATVLGNGRFFTMRQQYKPQKINTFGYPKMLVQLEIEYSNGSRKTISSDDTWKLSVDGPIRSNNEYDGEEYDATKEIKGWNSAGFNDSAWMFSQLVAAPEGKLVAQMSEPMKEMKTIHPVGLKRLSDHKFILDMGQNFAGYIKLFVKGKRGDQVTLRFAESLQSSGELYVANLRDAKVMDVYTLRGGERESWQPFFVYHGFRYVEISNYPGVPTLSDFEGKLVYDNLKTTGSFQSSNETMNRIYQNAWWGIASNYKGMPIDCPQRNERQPWLGDRATGSTGESFLFDNAQL